MRGAIQRASIRVNANDSIIKEARRKVLEAKEPKSNSKLTAAMRAYILKKASFKDEVF